MAMFGSNMPSEVGLRVLLCPLGSNVVIQTACCSLGTVLPVYSTFKAIESRDEDEQQKWLLYWAAYGFFSVVELFTDKFLYRFPFYYHMKFAFLVWLQLPSVDMEFLFTNKLIKMMFYRQALLLLFFAGSKALLYKSPASFSPKTSMQMVKFVSTHHNEIEFTRTFLMKILGSASHVVQDIINPGKRQINGASIEGPPEHVETSESEDEE